MKTIEYGVMQMMGKWKQFNWVNFGWKLIKCFVFLVNIYIIEKNVLKILRKYYDGWIVNWVYVEWKFKLILL